MSDPVRDYQRAAQVRPFQGEIPATDDRLAEAWAEAERRFPDGACLMRGQDRLVFIRGVEWADANPQPHAITRAELDEAAMLIADDLPARGTPPAYVLIERALSVLGIEVVGDE